MLYYPREYSSKVAQEISRLSGLLKKENEARALAEKKLQELEPNMTQLKEKNAELEQTKKDQEEVFKDQLKTVCDNLETTEAELSSLKKLIDGMVASVVGKLLVLL